MRKRLRKVWQFWLVISIPICFIRAIFWVCCLDSESVIPIIMCGLNVGWLFLMCMANDESRIDKKEVTHGTKDKKHRINEFQRHSA